MNESDLEKIFAYSPVSGGVYSGESLPVQHIEWPKETWFTNRLKKNSAGDHARMKHIVILAGPCVKREIMPEINRQIKMHQCDLVELFGEKKRVPTAVIAERLRTASEPTRDKLVRALKSPEVRLGDDYIAWE